MSKHINQTIYEIDPRELKPSVINNKVYKKIDRQDPDIKALARDISEKGVLEPLVISTDGYIISGHRRREAAIVAGLKTVPSRTMDIRSDDPDYSSDFNATSKTGGWK